MLECCDGANKLVLDLERKTGGDTVNINLIGVAALGLEEKLMRGPLSEFYHFVLDTRTITRADAFDHTSEQGRLVEIGPNDFVGA